MTFTSFFTHYSLKVDFLQIYIIKINTALSVVGVPGRWFCPLPPHPFSAETHPRPFLLQCLWKTWKNPACSCFRKKSTWVERLFFNTKEGEEERSDALNNSK
ncbi:hypothetical protein Nmel_001985 [Mimus melanotis]